MKSNRKNNPNHSSKLRSKLLQRKGLLECPNQSPDLNAIEILHHDLKRVIHTRHPNNIDELKRFVQRNGPTFVQV